MTQQNLKDLLNNPLYLEIKEKYFPDIDIKAQNISELKEKKGFQLNIVDFDDTLFSRNPQFAADKEFSLRRWDEWTKYVYEWYGIEKFIDDFYLWQTCTPEILKVFKSDWENQKSIVLTAWYEDLQKRKRDAIKDTFDTFIITSSGKNKPGIIVDFVLNNLWFIPEYINIYDDKVKDFESTLPFLALLLWSQFRLYQVNLGTAEISQLILEK